MSVKLVSITKPVGHDDPEYLMAYCARVSSAHQDNPDYEKLLKYCIKHGHWSVFEMSGMCVEITTSRAIAQQILRHKSFSFQEHSQRYAEAVDYIRHKARRQDHQNRQNSIDDMSPSDQQWFLDAQEAVWERSYTLYQQALEKGIAKEQARFLLPLSTKTRLYMNGTVRSWIHYISLRSGNGTQTEHSEIANQVKKIFVEQFPTIAKALEWT